jgi:membrane protein implicated in regulation of membrane protease activity
MLKKLLPILGVLALLALPALADDVKKSSGTKNGKPYFQASQKIEGEATVLAINKSTREVTLRSVEGDTTKLKCGPEVKNFAQIVKGDAVKVVYTETLTITVEPPGTAATTTETSTAVAKEGEKPHAGVIQKTTVKAEITAIDKAAGTATLKGADGEEHVVTPRNPANLDKVKIGDMVVITYTEGLAASVQKTAAKK